MTAVNTPDVTIRPYAPQDRQAVRLLACDTANAGQPVESFFKDRELAADLLTVYYTDFEPESAWIACQNGRVVGYLTGCRDTGRLMRCLAWRIAPKALGRALARGAMGDPDFRYFVRRNMSLWLGNLFRQCPGLNKYPAHLHLNLDTRFRGQHVGQRLMEKCLSRFNALHIKGVHASVREDNTGALRFFERLGFAGICRKPFLRTESATLYSIVLGNTLAA